MCVFSTSVVQLDRRCGDVEASSRLETVEAIAPTAVRWGSFPCYLPKRYSKLLLYHIAWVCSGLLCCLSTSPFLSLYLYMPVFSLRYFLRVPCCAVATFLWFYPLCLFCHCCLLCLLFLGCKVHLPEFLVVFSLKFRPWVGFILPCWIYCARGLSLLCYLP